MKNVKLLVVIVVFFVLTATVSYSVPFFTESGSGNGGKALIVETNVPGVDVYVDGKYKCTTYEQTERPEELKPPDFRLPEDLKEKLEEPEDGTSGPLPPIAPVIGGILGGVLILIRKRLRPQKPRSPFSLIPRAMNFARTIITNVKNVARKIYSIVKGGIKRIFSPIFKFGKMMKDKISSVINKGQSFLRRVRTKLFGRRTVTPYWKMRGRNKRVSPTISPFKRRGNTRNRGGNTLGRLLGGFRKGIRSISNRFSRFFRRGPRAIGKSRYRRRSTPRRYYRSRGRSRGRSRSRGRGRGRSRGGRRR